MPKITNPLKGITTPLKGTISKIQEKLNISAYNRLYKEYEKAHKKYNALITSQAPRKKGAKSSEDLALKEEKTITTLLTKMNKYPEIHKTNEQNLKQDMIKRKSNHFQKQYDKTSNFLEITTQDLNNVTQLQEHAKQKLDTIETQIEKVTKLVNATPLDKEALYEKEIEELKATFQETTSKLNADRSNEKAQTSYGDALLKYRTRMDQIETERRAGPNMDDKNKDHLESLNNEKNKIISRLNNYETSIITFNRSITHLTNEKDKIAKQLEALDKEKIELEAHTQESSKETKLTSLSTKKVSPVANKSKGKEQIASSSKEPHIEVAQIKDAGETLKRYTSSKTERGTGPVIGTRSIEQHVR